MWTTWWHWSSLINCLDFSSFIHEDTNIKSSDDGASPGYHPPNLPGEMSFICFFVSWFAVSFSWPKNVLTPSNTAYALFSILPDRQRYKLPHLAISSALLEGTFFNLLSQTKMWNTMPLWISTRGCYYQSLLIFNIRTSKSLFSDWCRNLPSLIVSIQIWKSTKRPVIGNKLWGHKFFLGLDNLYKCQWLPVASCQYRIEDAFFQPSVTLASSIRYCCVAIHFDEKLQGNFRKGITP